MVILIGYPSKSGPWKSEPPKKHQNLERQNLDGPVGCQSTRHTVNSSQPFFCDELTIFFRGSVTSWLLHFYLPVTSWLIFFFEKLELVSSCSANITTYAIFTFFAKLFFFHFFFNFCIFLTILFFSIFFHVDFHFFSFFLIFNITSQYYTTY